MLDVTLVVQLVVSQIEASCHIEMQSGKHLSTRVVKLFLEFASVGLEGFVCCTDRSPTLDM